jgi:hypothetical protein
MIRQFNPDGGVPYTAGTPSFSEPTLLMILAFIAAGQTQYMKPLADWVLKRRNSDGSIGLNDEFPKEGLWATPLLAIAMHRLGFNTERDAAIDFILGFRSLSLRRSKENDLDTSLTGWPWAPNTTGWVEPTSWALLSLTLAGKGNHQRSIEGKKLLADRCLPEGGWNYGNKIVFNNTLLPFPDTTALALLALGTGNPDFTGKDLDLIEKSIMRDESIYSNALSCICLDYFGRNTGEFRNRIAGLLEREDVANLNLAHSALAMIALSTKRVLTL